ncbi:hypothetical protein QCA50_010761 [Cerrena zonata]|uniref:Uncharacterized protein n=1 Tax=Cerrena zonata TaxID=2478898 RepID=A0AAW0G8K4_9APHY
MQFSLSKLFAVVAVVAATANALPASETEAKAAVPSPLTPQIGAPVPAVVPAPQDFNVGTVWTNSNKGGSAGNLNVGGIPSGCRNFVSPFIDSISSIQVNSGIRCVFFVDINCKGASITVQNGAFVADLQGTNFQDSLSSFSCFAN